VERYSVGRDSDRADPTSAKLVITVEQPFANHNGGLVLFGPDGMLYVGLGDGGLGGDPEENGQNLGVLLGKILRLDVDSGSPYAIPPDNPFAGRQGARGEIWAYGLRNPWRFAFDRATGELYIADVGQDLWEEIDIAPAGRGGQNYGWDRMEGAHCFEPPSGCDRSGLTLPVLEYGHGAGCSITGGHAYRGAALPSLAGTYFYADYCSGFVRSFKLAGGRVTEERSWPALEPPERLVTSFGEDAAGELYVMSQSGAVYRVVPE
jgi:glucose/arabinose dehydrogenase